MNVLLLNVWQLLKGLAELSKAYTPLALICSVKPDAATMP
jgi:hypothetical protein